MDGALLRQTMLNVLNEKAANSGAMLNSSAVIEETARRLKVQNKDTPLQRAVLALWHDLICSGHVAWGHNLGNPCQPNCHITRKGEELLKNLSRDPWNRDGYMNHLKSVAALSNIAGSYIEEALSTYAASCYKATAIMVGGAAERMILDLRDAITSRLQAASAPIPPKLLDWKTKTVFDAISRVLDPHKADMTVKLRESYEAYWPAFAQQLRAIRNDAGHPASIDPVSADMVHAAMLAFPELARLASDLSKWVQANL